VSFLSAAQMRQDEIGGGIVRRTFRMGTNYVPANTRLTPEQVFSIRPANRQALIDKGFIVVWPKGGDAPAIAGKKFAVHRGAGLYDVYEGRKLNDEPLSREEAELLVTGKQH
jgi:hypothetical protein